MLLFGNCMRAGVVTGLVNRVGERRVKDLPGPLFVQGQRAVAAALSPARRNI